jgi:hypothetical protein
MGRKKASDGPGAAPVTVICSSPKERGTNNSGEAVIEERYGNKKQNQPKMENGGNPVVNRPDAKPSGSGNPDLASEALDQLLKQKG